MANCFIVMPITTPETLVSSYGSDREHFHHVLEHLFVPAVEKAGLTAIRPLAQGADVIHAEIIKNIEPRGRSTRISQSFMRIAQSFSSG